ncbi:MAG: DNA polymerase III subunit delta [Bacteroidetes bacterium 4572_114]|nr:MAG: DNA polymerase III subunit delta [Bacteroidetes bacterium 4572_114]
MLFKEIIGQEKIKERLLQTVMENRVSHAQLFFGGEGRGKLSIAIAYAQFINCRDQEKFIRKDSCGLCPSCIKYDKLIHPDLHFVFPVAANKEVKEKPLSQNFMAQWREMLIENHYFPSLNDWYDKIDIERKQAGINVHDSNQIIRTLSYTSYESEYKVMIIWMVEKLNYQAAPKLLKIIEEPPDKTLFLLITENPDNIIPTILSRTQLVKFPKIEDNVLIGACETQLEIGHNQAVEISRVANGNFKEAMRLAGQKDERNEVFEKFVGWMRMCYTLDVPKMTAFSETMGRESRESIKGFLLSGMEVLRNCLVLNYTSPELIKIRGSELDFMKKFSPFINGNNAEKFSEEFNQAIYHIGRNANTGLVLFDLSLTVAKLLKIKAPVSVK